jgi:predicted phosphodiesterase
MMRVAVISDVHGNLVALELVLADIRKRAPDVIVNLGDCVTSPLWPRETMELLESLGLPTVRGNHDRLIADMPKKLVTPSVRFAHDSLTEQQRSLLGALPPAGEFEGVLAVHGTPKRDDKYLLEQNVDGRLALARTSRIDRRLDGVTAGLVLCGHSHQQRVIVSKNRVVLNPGSVGCPRYADDDRPGDAEAGSPHARYAIATKVSGSWTTDMFALAYDWSRVTDQAKTNGRDDWAEGFMKGMVTVEPMEPEVQDSGHEAEGATR